MLVPIVVVIGLGINSSPYLNFPPSGLSSYWLGIVATSSDWRDAFQHSVILSSSSSVLSVSLATCAALGIRDSRWPRLWQTLMLLPLIVPSVVIALALYPFYVNVNLIGTMPGLAFAHTLISFPYAFLTLWGAIYVLDPNLERAAASLGANRWTVIRRITIPLLIPAIAAALVIAAVVSFDEIVLTLFLSSPQTVTIPVRLWSFVRENLGPELAAASLLVVLINITIMIVALLVGQWAVRRHAAVIP